MPSRRRDVGTRQQRGRISTAQQGSRISPSTLGLLIKYTVILNQNYFKNIKISRSERDLGKEWGRSWALSQDVVMRSIE